MQLVQYIRQYILSQPQGRIDFAHYMNLALYAPGLGYYSAGTQKFGKAGDFITAPELTPLFGQCIANQVAEVLHVLGEGDVLEFGAGSGRLAVDVLQALATQQALPRRYYILEVSASLRARQQALLQETVPALMERVVWLDTLPTAFEGVILANEVLDAMPVHRFRQAESGVQESFVYWEDKLVERFEEASGAVAAAVAALGVAFELGYTSEISLVIPAWIRSVADCLTCGVVLLVDYGFGRSEYYHPDRSMGTLMCHYQHRAHDDVFLHPGLQDITAHVDFTAVAEGAHAAGMEVMGYTTQAHFLMGCGLLEMLDMSGAASEASYQMAQAAKQLLLPSEMGELFKVIALGKDFNLSLRGMVAHDMCKKIIPDPR